MIFASQMIDLACRVGGPKFAHRIYLSRLERWRTYEPEYYMLDHLIDRDRTCIDVGANEGVYSGRLAQIGKRVHCFEPIPWFANALRKKLSHSVTIHECALSNQTGVGFLRIPYTSSSEMHGASTLETHNPLAGFTHIKTIPCRLERLDKVVDEPVGFIKIDVEGHELAVLEGAIRILRAHKPVLLIESEKRHNPNAPENVFSFLKDFGYIGLFLRRENLFGLSDFDVAIDQKITNIRNIETPYINNFIFIPGKLEA